MSVVLEKIESEEAPHNPPSPTGATASITPTEVLGDIEELADAEGLTPPQLMRQSSRVVPTLQQPPVPKKRGRPKERTVM